MAFVHGRNAVVLLGEYNLTGYCDNIDIPQSMDVAETTAFGNTAKTYIPGLKDSSFSLGGLADYGANASDVVVQATITNANQTAKIFSMAPNGLTRGNRVWLAQSFSTNYSQAVPVADVVKWTLDAQATGGVAGGVSLHDLTAVTGSADDPSVNNTASTANGIVAHLHVTAVTAVGGDTLNVDVSDSSDNITFVDKINFTQVTTAVTKERLTATGTINQYLRVEKTKGGVGTPSWTIAVTCARL